MKLMQKITQAAKYLVMIAVVVMMLLTVTDVILRRFFASPILGVTEYSQMVMVVILLATACTAMNNGHIKVDILVSRFSQKGQYICELVTLALSFVTSLLLATRAFKEGLVAIQSRLMFITVKVSKAPFIFLYSLGLFVLALAAVCLFVDTARKLRRCGREEAEP